MEPRLGGSVPCVTHKTSFAEEYGCLHNYGQMPSFWNTAYNFVQLGCFLNTLICICTKNVYASLICWIRHLTVALEYSICLIESSARRELEH